jgi:AcrR family transcriptional regulator
MLDAAVAMVHRSGLTVSLDHIRFEDVIRDAGVSRSSAYRRWPYKDQFVAELLLVLADASSPARVTGASDGEAWVRSIVRRHRGALDDAAGRHALGLELFRLGVPRDFDTMHRSTEWRTYLALHATFAGLADGDLRDQVQHALAASEQRFTERLASSYESMASLLGYRLRPELHATFETMATVCGATLRGLVLASLSTPGVARRRVRAAPFGAAGAAPWSVAALGVAAVAFGFLEPDPTVVWDAARIAALHDVGASPARRRRGAQDRRPAAAPSTNTG